MNTVFRVIIFLLTASSINLSYSQTLYVDSAVTSSGAGGTWATAFKTLSEALDSAHHNPAIDSILVAKGTYYPTKYPYHAGAEINTGIKEDKTFHIPNGLELYGGYATGGASRNVDIYPTILYGDSGSYKAIHVVLMENSLTDTAIIDGFSITKGHPSPGSRIMPLNINGHSIVHVGGGGLYVDIGLYIINNCKIYDNSALEWGAGVYANGTNLKISNSYLYNNSFKDALSLWGGNYIVENNRLDSNIGTGIFGYNVNSIMISNNNITRSFEDGVHISGGNCKIISNIVSSNDGTGISISQAKGIVYNNIIAYNRGAFGGGLYFGVDTGYIVNNTFYRNESSFGGGFFSDLGAMSHLYNNVFWENKTSHIDSPYADVYNKSSTILAKNNSFQLDSAKVASLPLATGSANNLYKVNPLFKGGSGADSLMPDISSAILDKGDSSLYTYIIKKDYLQNARIKYKNIDIGAIETDFCTYGLGVIRVDTFYDTICKGDSFFFVDQYFYASGLYSKTIDTSPLCMYMKVLLLYVTKFPISKTIQNVKCFGDSTGKIVMNISGGLPSYTYNWSNGATTDSISNLKAGVYICTITDNLGCVKIDTTVIQENTIIGYTVSASFNGCYGQDSGQIYIAVSGGIPPYRYSWSNGDSLSHIKRLYIGIYTVTITDSVGCTKTQSVDLNPLQPPKIMKSISQSICAGSSYLFNGIQRTTAGTYFDTLVATNGCDSFITLNLTISPISSHTINVTECKGKIYLFNGIQRGTSGTYLDTFTAANGCDSIVTLNLLITSPPIVVTQDSSDFSSPYSWRGGSYSTAGTYYDTSTAANKCDTIYKLILTSYTPILPSARPHEVIYSNDTLYSSIDSATSYQWYLCGPPMRKITGATKRHFYTKDKSLYTVVAVKNGKADTAACRKNAASIQSDSKLTIQIFPNPAKSRINILLDKKYRNIELTILSIDGKKQISSRYSYSSEIVLNLMSLSNGIYFIHLVSGEELNEIQKITISGE